MVGNIQPTTGGNSPYSKRSGNALKERMPRAEYKSDTKTFQPMSEQGNARSIEHMEKVEETVAQLPVPPDFSSHTYLKKVQTKNHFKCNLLSPKNAVAAFSLKFFS